MKKKGIRLCGYVFPYWLFTYLPAYWWITLPGNFIIDSVALLLAVWMLKPENPKEFFRKHILKLFWLGFLSDFITTLLMVGVYSTGMAGPAVYSMKIKLPGFVLGTVLLLPVYYFLVFNDQNRKTRILLSLFLTVATAPYSFLLPLS